VPTRTPSAHATWPKGRGALLAILTSGLLFAGLAAAGPAAAIDDPARPDARVTHGPSCRPGGVVVEVRAGTEPYAVTLATTRSPGGEDAAELEPGETVLLSSGDVAWGETIDGYLEYRPLDGSARVYVDDLAGYTFTRPAEEDCAAIIAPAPATVPLTPPGLDPASPGAPADPGVPAEPEAPADPGSARPAADDGVPLGTAEVAPVALAQSTSIAPLFAAAVALVGAVAGLVVMAGRHGLAGRQGFGGRQGFAGRRPTRNA
jgi:hypothetical protein